VTGLSCFAVFGLKFLPDAVRMLTALSLPDRVATKVPWFGVTAVESRPRKGGQTCRGCGARTQPRTVQTGWSDMPWGVRSPYATQDGIDRTVRRAVGAEPVRNPGRHRHVPRYWEPRLSGRPTMDGSRRRTPPLKLLAVKKFPLMSIIENHEDVRVLHVKSPCWVSSLRPCSRGKQQCMRVACVRSVRSMRWGHLLGSAG
jgi:hypothetical protein